MQRVVTYTRTHSNGNTRLHGNGDELIINSMVKAEYARQREADNKRLESERKKHEIEMRCMNLIMNSTKSKCNKLVKEKYIALKAQPCIKPNKAKAAFEFIIACYFSWGEALGRLEYNHDTKEWKRK